MERRDREFRTNCPSIPVVPVHVLLASSSTGDEDSDVEPLLRDHIVLYGAHFRGDVDVINTPLHNELPGVFLHAMALDNLITMGGEYVRYEEHELRLPFGASVEVPDAILLAFAGILFAVHKAVGLRRVVQMPLLAITPGAVERRLRSEYRRVSRFYARAWSADEYGTKRPTRMMERFASLIASAIPGMHRLLKVVVIMIGPIVIALFLLLISGRLLACRFHLGARLFGFGTNWLFVVSWLEIVEVVLRLEEADENSETEPHRHSKG